MDVFRKPHIAGALPAPGDGKPRPRRRNVFHPYPKRLFQAYDVFPLLPLDGGAFFFTHRHLGGASAAQFLAAFEDGSLLRPWTVRGKVQWDKAYDDTAGSLCRTAFEQHVWLNRLYFLLPLAQQFLRTRQEKWARAWLEHFTAWSAAHPYGHIEAAIQSGRFHPSANPFRVPAGLHAKFCWRDMQVTWRLLVFLHSVYLLETSRSLKKKDWHAVYQALHLHARHVHVETTRELATHKGHGNHFLQKGVALLYTGILFPEFPEAAEFIEAGRAVLKHQMRTEVHPDGGSIEASPSYSHFIARLYLDAFLLLCKNKQPPIKGLKTSIRNQYRFLDETASPSGQTLQLSDSYAMDADLDLKIASGLFPFGRATRTRSTCFKSSSFAVLRSKRLDVYVDGMSPAPWHVHSGKPNLVVFADGEPLLVDSGCCDYDLELREGWLKTAAAHNTVLVSAEGSEHEGPPAADVPSIRVAGFERSRHHAAVMMIHELASPGLRYEWTRSVLVRANTVEVIDRIAAPAPVRARQVFHFAPLNVGVSGDGHQATVQRPGGDVIVRQVGDGQGHFELTWRPAVGPDNRLTYAPELTARAHGKEILFHVRFTLP